MMFELMKKILLGIVAIAFICSVSIHGEPIANKNCSFSCTLFGSLQDEVFHTGHIGEVEFQKWFKNDYEVLGERIEVPETATIFGALVVTDGKEIVLMPFYTWTSGGDSYFACQSHEFGKAPMFCVFERSRKSFISAIKTRLDDLHTKN